MWSCLFAAIAPVDPPVAFFYPQKVCDQVCLLKFHLLTLLWPCATLRMYVIQSFCYNSTCWPSCGFVPPSESMWSGLFAVIPPADPFVALFYPQTVGDLVYLLQFHLLTLLWHCSTLRKYVIWSVCCNSTCWPTCGFVPPSASMRSSLFAAIWSADLLVALFHPQLVCDLVCLLQFHLLTLLWPCSTLRMYVIWFVCHNSSSWPSCGLVPPSESTWSGLFAAIPPADPPVVLFHPQLVCDLVCLLQFHLLTLLWPCFTLSLYVIWFVCCNLTCWPFCGRDPPLGCMQSCLFTTIPPADSPVALFHPQDVCDLACLLQFHLLTLLWPCSTLRMYVIWSVC
jgi:hypothetical protein